MDLTASTAAFLLMFRALLLSLFSLMIEHSRTKMLRGQSKGVEPETQSQLPEEDNTSSLDLRRHVMVEDQKVW